MYVGIDLGTTYCAVARLIDGSPRPELIRNAYDEFLTPSVICFQPDGTAFCGKEAKDEQEAGNVNCASAFKRNMNTLDPIAEFFGRNYTAEELSSLMLKTLKNEAEASCGEEIKGAVITVPAYFEDIQRRATIQACESSGLSFMGLLDEPVAAAMSFGLNSWKWKEGNVIMVYDLGGGTFDVTIVRMLKRGRMEVISTNGNHQLGGINFDRELLNCICDSIQTAHNIDVHDDIDFAAENIKAVERLKIHLSTVSSFTESFEVSGRGIVKVSVTREDFEQRCRSLIGETISLCDNMLDAKGVKWSNLDDVVLVGGSTRLPMVKEAIRAKFGRFALETLNPDTAVAEGAAIRASILAKDFESDENVSMSFIDSGKNNISVNLAKRYVHTSRHSSSSDGDDDPVLIRVGTAVPHSLGVIAVSADGKKYVNRIIIPKDTQRPCRKAEEFRFITVEGEDNLLEIYVMQGEVEDSPLQNHIFARYTANVPYEGKRETRLRVQYSYDENGVCNVQVRTSSGTQDLPLHREPSPGDIDRFGLPPERTAQEIMNIMLCVDVSGSMSGSPLREAKKAMRNFVRKMGENACSSFCISVVSDDVEYVGEEGFTNDPERAISYINEIMECMTGVCNNAHPFDLARRVFVGCSGRKVMVVLTDGVWEYQDEAVSVAEECQAMGIEICGIGFGGADTEFISAISSVEDASIYTESYSGLGAAFGSIAQVLSEGVSGHSGGIDLQSQEVATWDDGSPVIYRNRY